MSTKHSRYTRKLKRKTEKEKKIKKIIRKNKIIKKWCISGE